jgi:DNA-binding transcriptional regulator GbsR (MarR family)
MAGRVIGWLLLCDPPEQSAAQVGEVVGASKGSISTMLRLLVQRGIVEVVGIPGERSRFYRIREGAWAELMRGRMTFVQAARELAERGLQLMKGAEPQRLQRLQEFHDLHALLERELPAMLARYERGSKTRPGNRKTRSRK